MKTMPFSLVQLQYILELTKTKHFGEAAKNCLVTQPTLSTQIAKVETAIGLKLFVRERNEVELSDAGKLFVESAKQILKGSQLLTERMKEACQDVSGEVKVAIIPTISPWLVPLFYSGFMKSYPGVKLTLIEEPTKNILSLFHEAEIDAAILSTPIDKNHNLDQVKLYDEEIYLCVHKDHPLAAEEEVAINDVPFSELILLDKGNCFREQAISLCQIVKKDYDESAIEFHSGQFTTLIQLVRRGLGITFLPELMVQDIIKTEKDNSLKFLNLKEPVPLREVSLCFGKQWLKRTTVSHFQNVLMESLPSYLKREKKEGTVLRFDEGQL